MEISSSDDEDCVADQQAILDQIATVQQAQEIARLWRPVEFSSVAV